eukprot:8382592-Ditylum_brightwellii.AAC.1
MWCQGYAFDVTDQVKRQRERDVERWARKAGDVAEYVALVAPTSVVVTEVDVPLTIMMKDDWSTK